MFVMTQGELLKLLKLRSGLTSQPYGDEVIEAWMEAFGDQDFADCRTALVDAAKANQRVTVAHVAERLTPTRRSTRPAPWCSTCDGTGMRSAMQAVGGREYSVVVACADCDGGREAGQSLRRIDAANAAANAVYRQSAGPVHVEPSMPSDGPAMTFDEYITRLSWLAGTGDHDAGAALDEWSTPFAREMLDRLLRPT